MSYVFREARPDDAEALLVHLKTVGGETDNLTFGSEGFSISPEREARFIGRFIKNSDEVMYVVTDGSLIVGNGVIERERIPRLSHRARLTLTVMRDYWGQGIGTRLMELMMDFCKSSGLKTLSLEARADNTRAISLYKKFGFEEIGIYRSFFKIDGNYYDGILMQLIF